jgi:putative cell wall-binding protein
LERAHETAEEITARSRSRADDRVQAAEREAEQVREAAAHDVEELRSTAKREAEELRETAAKEAHQVRTTAQREAEAMRVAAEARVRELDRNADELWDRRRQLIKDMRAVAQQQLEIANDADARFAREPDAPAGETPQEA